MTNNGGTAVQRADEFTSGTSVMHGGREAFEVAQRMANALASSSVVPAAFKGNLANVMVAMEYANRLGASVLAVMQNLDVIHGRPSLRASFLIGTVNACGRFTPIRFRFQGTEGTDTWGCRAVAVDRESKEECVGPLITLQLAKDEGWYGKAGSKWKSIPELMLMYRAGAWWSRVYCPELSLGLHTTDEAEDLGPPPEARIRNAALALDSGDPVDGKQYSELEESIIEFINTCEPRGGDATAKQRERIIEIAGRVCDDGGFMHAGLLSLANNPAFGKGQAGAMVGKLKELQKELGIDVEAEPVEA